MERKVVFLSQYLILVLLLLGQLHCYKSCIGKERKALLELKEYIISTIGEEEANDFVYPTVFPTWTNDTKSNCCQWEEVECNTTTGRVIGLYIGQLVLNNKKTSLLNLSLLHPFEDLRSLNLSESRFNGFFDEVEDFISLRSLNNLEILDLSSNTFNNRIFPFLNAATSLKRLSLRGTHVVGRFPGRALRDLRNLEFLDLSMNSFNGSIPVQELSILRNLKALDLSNNQFSDSMDFQGICKLRNIQELDLSKNKLVGQIPLCLTSLTGLQVLDLSSNHLTGKLPSTLGNLESLEYLSLFDNNFEGSFALDSLANLSELKVLKLFSKSSSLQVESKNSWKPKFQLNVITLRSCKLEKVPHFILHQKALRLVDLSDNNISGTFPSWLLANNTKLEVLLLQNNSFTSFHIPESTHKLTILDVSVNEFNQIFPENIGWILPHLRYMHLAENGFQGNLPSSLGNMKEIEYLDASHNSFRGKLPISFVEGCYSMRILKLSHNKLSGEIFPETTNFTRIWDLSMDNNLFAGKIGRGLRSLIYLFMLDISNNSLTGVIPSWIGELQNIDTLLAANNSLEGEIPVSLFNISYLQVLDLSANNLYGAIPPRISSEVWIMLFLQDNNLSGEIPYTFLENVRILDLRNNRLSGNIPEFINIQSISVLLLRGNNFTGPIPHQLCGLRNIQLLDLSNNSLNGSIPSCFSNTSFALGIEYAGYASDQRIISDSLDVDIYFNSLITLNQFSIDYTSNVQTRIKFATKHRFDVYTGGNLDLLFGLDFSENELSGEIPFDFGSLVELQALNLSHNKLSGVIPESFSGMKNVESLDLSFNRLQGRIPPELTDLRSLAVFNVSYNNVSGIIPQGRQFNTFDTQSYLSNPLLCGQPTNRSCSGNNFQESDDRVEVDELDESTIDMVSFYWSFAASYVTVLVGIFASLSFDSPWRRFWFYMVDAFIHKARNLFGKTTVGFKST